ncbi:MAG: FMN-binding protein, partial [Lachnospiraceae bacterium]|nr:FMN-binding protein [Lachnospiraceae bacterium]
MGRLKILLLCAVTALAAPGCADNKDMEVLQDGSYTAQMKEYSYGWQEYVTIVVKNGEIVSTEFNAENASGFIKSWDNAYMQNMNPVSGTYPNEYTRYYAAQLTGRKETPDIDLLTGATSSGDNFQRLSEAVVKQALKGDSSVVYVAGSSTGHE